MSYRRHQKVFFGLVAAAILVDSSFDFLTLRQSYVTDQTGRSIEHSYAVLAELSEVGLAIRDNTQAHLEHDEFLERQSVRSLQEHLLSVTSLTAGNKVQQDQFKPFNFILESDSDRRSKIALSTRALSSAIANARKQEQTLLIKSMREDEAANITSRNQIILASLFDLLLIVMAGVAWYVFNRARKENEAALQKSIQSSEVTISELRRVLDKKALELRSTVHDLKNPLGSIKGFSGLIEEECSNPGSVAEMSQALQRLSDHTLSLVNSLLEVESKSPTFGSEARTINIISYIEDVIFSLKPQAKKKHQKIQFSHQTENGEVFGDPKKLWDLFMNLIGNAVKYSPVNTTISVRAAKTESTLCIEIEDEGPGFTSQDKQSAFGQFQKLSAKPTGGETSSGMGLKIAWETTQLHNGTITILDAPKGRGSMIVVRLPLEISVQSAKSISPRSLEQTI